MKEIKLAAFEFETAVKLAVQQALDDFERATHLKLTSFRVDMQDVSTHSRPHLIVGRVEVSIDLGGGLTYHTPE